MVNGKLIGRIALVAMLSAPAFGQVLDFDAACGSPPCAAGTLYSASGITIAPGTTPIVAGGTDGLTGITGPRFLYVATPPYQATITPARQATFVTVSLARATSSASTVVVSISAFKSGLLAGSTTVTLTAVNQWIPASLSLPGGFDSLVISGTGGGNLTFGVDNLQFGGTCNGFADVSPSDTFCNAAEWLANRSVTIGCAAGQYCPSQPVTRGAMALFLQRMGVAIAPTFRHATDFFLGDFQAPALLCETPEFRVVGNPRTATARAAVIGSGAASLKVLGAQIAYSTDGGASWNVPATTSVMPHSIEPDRAASWMTHAPRIAMDSGNAYRFAVRFTQPPGYGTTTAAAIVRAECELLVRIENANGSTAPFDVVD